LDRQLTELFSVASQRLHALQDTPGAACGEPEAFGLPIHDNWWQTETGGIMIANYAAMPIKPGSMGKPLPGIEAAIVQRVESGELKVVREANTQGELARLAVHVPRLSQRSGALPQMLVG
jgi:hypothetical protein